MHDRSRERQALRRKLEQRLSIHMPAPRRIGKTWTIGRLAADLRNAGWLVIEADVQGVRTQEKFATELCARIEEQFAVANRVKAHLMQRLSNLLGGDWGDRPLDALGRVDPISFAETLVASLNQSEKDVVIIVDEISYFFLALAEQDALAAHAFAYQLRALQLRYKNVRWLITGSIGLDIIARRYDLQGAFVDFETFELLPFNKTEARSYLRDTAVQQQLNHPFQASDEDFDEMFDNLGWLAPFYLKLVANEVRPSIPEGEPWRATRADFETAFERLLQPNRRAEFAVWREHVSKNLPASDRIVASQLLRSLSVSPQGETKDTLHAQMASTEPSVTRRQLLDVLDMLASDGLLLEEAGRVRFRSGLVRRYWQEHEAE